MATNSPAREPVWVRSLYWRTVLAFCVCIGGVLAVQMVAVVLWLKSAPDPPRLHAFTDALAADPATAMAGNPRLDVQSYVDTRYRSPLASLYIIVADTGQVVCADPLRPPGASIVAAQDFYRQHPPALPESWITGPYQVARIVVRGKLAGGVGVVVPLTWKQLVGWKMAGLPFIFDRFYKVGPARTAGWPLGSRLGLSIVKAIVERHGGTVSVLSDPGVATVFAIQLPL
jgi:hypothetical protein